MDSFDGQFARRLAREIEQAIATEADHLANGLAKTFDDYQKRAGKIAGLRAALDLMQQAETDLRKL